jgi:hypothetical protein
VVNLIEKEKPTNRTQDETEEAQTPELVLDLPLVTDADSASVSAGATAIEY